MNLHIILLSALLAAALLGGRLIDLHGLDPEQATQEGQSEARRLFEAMQREGLLTLDNRGQVLPAPADEVLAQRAAGAASEGLGRKERLLHAFYHSTVGEVLAGWLRQWNRGRVLSGVRDNRPSLPHGVDEVSAERDLVGWSAWNEWNEPVGTHGRMPVEFGYLMNGDLLAGFGDWTVAPAETVTYRTRVRLAARATLQLHLVGRPVLSTLPGASALGCLREPPKGHPHCAKPKAGMAYDAWQISIPLLAGSHALELEVAPVLNPVPDDHDLPLALEGRQLVWKPQREHYGEVAGIERPTTRFVLETKDGVLLTEESGSGQPTPFTLEHGLAGLVGFGPEYRNTLTGLLSRSSISDAGGVTLTLDSRLQALAQAELNRKLNELADPGDPGASARRGAVVLLDPWSGAILAAASHPQPPSGTHRWDRAAFAVNWPNLDPFRFTPWQGLDNHSAPGSTFKPVTALAAISAFEQGQEVSGTLAEILDGLSPTAFRRRTGIAMSDACYQPKGASRVCNFGKVPLKDSVQPDKLLRDATCEPSPPISSTLGLREAVRDSLNIWFVRLAQEVDAVNLGSGGPDTFLFRQAHTLGFGPPFALFPDIGGVPRDNLAVWSSRGSVLKAQTGGLDLGDPSLGAPMQRLTQNAFGQGVRATPLQMARVVAAIATGKIPQPTLLWAWEGAEVDAGDHPNLVLDERGLGLLREGMKAVPETGTAAQTFAREYPRGRCRTFGKTGTAQTRESDTGLSALFSAWFVGWRESTATTPEIAFACTMTHLPDTREHTGGRLCGEVVARILAQWYGDDVASR